MKTNRYIVIALLLSIFVSSCEDGFLKQDPQTSLSSPVRLNSFIA